MTGPAPERLQRSANVGRRLGVDLLFERAATRCDVLERRYTIAGRGVCIRFAGPGLATLLGGPLAHLEDVRRPAELVINVWDTVSTGIECSSELGRPAAGDGTGSIVYSDRDGVRALSRWNTLSVFDTAAGEAWFCVPDPARMLSWDWASPLRTIFHWWLGLHGVLLVHGAAVGLDGLGGVLVVGPGGSGKSTASLACLGAGFEYAGDDFVGLEVAPDPQVHSLYCSGKLDSRQLERFPELYPALMNPVRGVGEKAIVATRNVPGATVTSGFRLRSVLVPRIAGGAGTRVVPVPAAAALAALAPSTIFQLHPRDPHAFRQMAELVASVPCYSLELGTRLEAIPAAITELLESL